MIIGSDALGTEPRKLYSPVGTEVAFLFIFHHFNQLGAGGETLVGIKKRTLCAKAAFCFPIWSDNSHNRHKRLGVGEQGLSMVG